MNDYSAEPTVCHVGSGPSIFSFKTQAHNTIMGGSCQKTNILQGNAKK